MEETCALPILNFRCPRGELMQPADFLLQLLPHQHDNIKPAGYYCRSPCRFTIPFVSDLIPPASKYFEPADLVDTGVALILLCVLVTVAMVICKMVWEHIDPNFSGVKPAHKKWYVIANVSKGFFLANLAFSWRTWRQNYSFCWLNEPIYEHDIVEVKRLAVLYVVTDVVALYTVPKLPKSTIAHHVATAILCMVVGAINLKENISEPNLLLGMARMMILYGRFSTVTFLVNLYLAFRVVYPNTKWLKILVTLSLWTYVLSCAGSWTTQVLWLVGQQTSLYVCTYAVIISVIVYDDCVLIGWLIRKSSPGCGT